MATPRKEPYVWVTWLAKLMAGEKACEFSNWFRAHYTYEKVPSDFDVAAWTVQHARRVRELRMERLQHREAVYVSSSNSFAYQPHPGVTLAGRPDLVGDSLLANPTVYSVKTGRPKTSDAIETIIYMHVLPLAIERYGGTEFDGCLVYDDRRIRIPACALDDAFVTNFAYFLDVIAGEAALPKAPSASECRSCDIPSSECPERFVAARGGLTLAYTRPSRQGELGITDANSKRGAGKVDGGGDARLLLHLGELDIRYNS